MLEDCDISKLKLAATWIVRCFDEVESSPYPWVESRMRMSIPVLEYKLLMESIEMLKKELAI